MVVIRVDGIWVISFRSAAALWLTQFPENRLRSAEAQGGNGECDVGCADRRHAAAADQVDAFPEDVTAQFRRRLVQDFPDGVQNLQAGPMQGMIEAAGGGALRGALNEIVITEMSMI